MAALWEFVSDPAVIAMLTWVGTLLGLLSVVFAVRFYWRGGARRGTLRISVRQLAAISLGPKGHAKIGTHTHTNLILIAIKITNGGPGDFEDTTVRDEGKRSLRPRILLDSSYTAVLDPWSPVPWDEDHLRGAELRASRFLEGGRQMLGLNLARLGVGSKVVNHVLLTDIRNPLRPRLRRGDVNLVAGFVPGRVVRGGGLLLMKRPLPEVPRSSVQVPEPTPRRALPAGD